MSYEKNYNYYKKKYFELKEDMKLSTNVLTGGGGIDKDAFERIRMHNLNVYFDRGRNNIWMEEKVKTPQNIELNLDGEKKKLVV